MVLFVKSLGCRDLVVILKYEVIFVKIWEEWEFFFGGIVYDS